MNAAAKAVNAGQSAHPCATKRRALNAVIAPKPILLSAAPSPSTHTEVMTFMNPDCWRGIGSTLCSGATKAIVRSGSRAVATAMLAKPKRA
jgi:hypothetical protein